MALTWTRMALIPVFVAVFYMPLYVHSPLLHWLAPPLSAFLFALAGITDWLDGWLARRWSVTSKLGAFLDPVADKILVAVALVVLVQADGRILLALPAAVIIGREITISALREWMAESGARSRVAVSWLGKLKTGMQIVSITMLLFRHDLGPLPVYTLGVILLFVAAVLTLWSMFGYLRAARAWLRDEAGRQ
ncbi:MAG TPA: CDP-diacylglycerol--glycerol-3-phosphate 3-phosphatidyltransferase [Gammaproteobacteria bacterium]|nr:CDP-diacylglycerol--glycerol-3-phosphate 3-phosphatidyltransferase [Gammaproteobacteria bacterium]